MSNRDNQDDVPDLLSDSDGNNSSDGEDDAQWEDVEDGEVNPLESEVTCLFCSQQEKSIEALLHHCKTTHGFDLMEVCAGCSMDCVSYIKMINYIRIKKPSPNEVKEASLANQLWASDDYMVAVDPNDLLLQFDIETAIEEQPAKQRFECADGEVPSFLESEAIMALIQRTQRAEEQRDLLKDELERALHEISRLRLTGQQLMIGAGDQKMSKTSQRTTLHEEDGYFASYSHFGIHHTMLTDKVRTESYRDFMLKNPEVFQGKTVLDVGCGTGILSMFAVKAGAAKVVAVDQSHIIYQAMDIARENNLHEKITFVKGRLEDVTLPLQKFDVIISEWMGYFLLFEAMLDSVLWARDHCLAPGGCVFPDHFTIQLVGVSDPKMRASMVEYWDDVYGYKMSCMKGPVLEEVHVKRLTGDIVATQPACIKTIDVMECQVKDLDFSTTFSLQCERDCELTAIVGYFDTDFSQGCKNKVSFSTGPQCTPTHWDQAVMMLQKPLTVTKGSSVDGSITYRKHPNDERGVIISLALGKQKMKYSLS